MTIPFFIIQFINECKRSRRWRSNMDSAYVLRPMDRDDPQSSMVVDIFTTTHRHQVESLAGSYSYRLLVSAEMLWASRTQLEWEADIVVKEIMYAFETKVIEEVLGHERLTEDKSDAQVL